MSVLYTKDQNPFQYVPHSVRSPSIKGSEIEMFRKWVFPFPVDAGESSSRCILLLSSEGLGFIFFVFRIAPIAKGLSMEL